MFGALREAQYRLKLRLRPALEYATSGLYDGTVHTFGQAPRYLPGWTFTRALPVEGQRSIRGAEVTLHLEGDDLVGRDPRGVLLGSMIDNWLVALSTHRLELLGVGDRSPRLRLGRVIVQRRTWLVEPDAAFRTALEGEGVEPMAALRSLRRQHGIPEEVFVRPLLPVRLTHHKDAKPIFVDFRSPLLLQGVVNLLRRYRQLRIVEALPRTEDCWLHDASGHYSCELRMLAIPDRATGHD